MHGYSSDSYTAGSRPFSSHFGTTQQLPWAGLSTHGSFSCTAEQECWAIVQMTARCTLHNYECPENFRVSLTMPVATFPEIFNGLFFRLMLWICLQNLKSVASLVPEIIAIEVPIFPTYVIGDPDPPTSHTDRRTDDMQSQDRALHYSASHSKTVTLSRGVTHPLLSQIGAPLDWK